MPLALLPKAQNLNHLQITMTPLPTILPQTREFAASAYQSGDSVPTKMPKT
jgi:hypothetical protein